MPSRVSPPCTGINMHNTASTPYEFDSHDADVILSSNEQDSREFHVHRSILAIASPFFRDMFSLPQPPTGNQALPVIAMSESFTTLDTLLRFVYPVPDPQVHSLDELVPILNAAFKYDFVYVITTLRKILLSSEFLQRTPMRVFIIACRYDLEEEAKIASQHTLREDILHGPLTDDLKHISAYSYHRLLDLHRSRARAAQDLLRTPLDLKCQQCNRSGHGAFGAPKWWYEFVTKAKEELAIRPSSDVIFRLDFLARVSDTGCPRCPSSLFESSEFLEELRTKIDELPATI